LRIEILLFARLRESAGTARAHVDAAEGRTVAQIAKTFLDERGVGETQRPPLRFAVNESFVADDHVPRDGDRLALLAPFAGG